MKKHGWTQTCSLSPAEFLNSGRGLITEESISSNQVIISIPVRLLITICSVAASDISWLFQTNHEHFFAQEVLAIFLVWEKHLREKSKWRPYINTLPSDYSIPLFCSQEELAILPTFISELVQKQTLKCKNAFDAIRRILNDKICSHCEKKLRDVFTYEEYKWAWSSVNTRCVYVDIKNSSKHDLRLKDKANIALAPFLDMFNHSNNAKVEVDSSNNNYEIKTLVSFNKYSQVFIHYGHHSNVKLYTEYGFVLPCNSHDFIQFSFEEVLSYIRNVQDIQNEQLKIDFLKVHRLTNDLSCNSEDMSFNMKVAIYVLVSTEKRKEIMTKKIYSCEFDEQENNIICKLGKQLVLQKYMEYKNISKAMDEKTFCGSSKSFLIAKELMLQYLEILENCANNLNCDTI